MYDDFFSHIRNYLLEIGFDKSEFLGASEEEIQKMEKKIGKPFPKAYKAWLRYFGKKMSYKVFDRIELTIDTLKEAKAVSKEKWIQEDFASATAIAKQELAEGISTKEDYEITRYHDNIYIGYVEHNEMLVFLSKIQLDDPIINYFTPPDELEKRSPYHFTSWVRERIILLLKLYRKLGKELNYRYWATSDPYLGYPNTGEGAVYCTARSKFTKQIEKRDHERGYENFVESRIEALEAAAEKNPEYERYSYMLNEIDFKYYELKNIKPDYEWSPAYLIPKPFNNNEA